MACGNILSGSDEWVKVSQIPFFAKNSFSISLNFSTASELFKMGFCPVQLADEVIPLNSRDFSAFC